MKNVLKFFDTNSIKKITMLRQDSKICLDFAFAWKRRIREINFKTTCYFGIINKDKVSLFQALDILGKTK